MKQNWIGQADELAAKSAVTEPEWNNQAYENTIGITQPATQIARTGVIHLPSAAPKKLTGVLQLHGMKVVTLVGMVIKEFYTTESHSQCTSILDLTGVVGYSDLRLFYKASIYGKSLDKQTRQILGEILGTFTPSDKISVKVEGKTPTQGFYRLEVLVSLSLESWGPTSHPVLMSLIESEPLHFY